MSTLAAQREEFARTLAGLRRAREEQGERLARNERALDDLRAGVQALQQAQTELNRAASERSIVGSDSHLRVYTAMDPKKIPATASRHYLRTREGVVRLTGHKTARGAYVYGLLDDPRPKTEWQREVQSLATMRSILRAHRAADSRSTPVIDEMLTETLRQGPAFVSRIFSDVPGQGAEWIPDTYGELEREVEHQVGFHSIFAERSVPPGGTLHMPFVEGQLRPYLGAVPEHNDPADATLSDFTTRENTITTKPITVASQMWRDATEDSVIATYPEILERIAKAIAYGQDDIALNGQGTTPIDKIEAWNTRGLWGDKDLGSGLDHRRLAPGLRARAYDINNAHDWSGSQNVDGFLGLIAKLGAEYAGKMGTGSLVFATSIEVFLAKLLTDSKLMTWDKLGSAATLLQGTIGQRGPRPGSIGFLGGCELVLPALLTADLASTGKYTGSGETSGVLVFDADDFEWRVRQGLTVETETRIRNNTVTAVARYRATFRTKANDTTRARKNVAWGYGLLSE